MKWIIFKFRTRYFLKDLCIVLAIVFHVLTFGWFFKKYSKEEIEAMDRRIEELNKSIDNLNK